MSLFSRRRNESLLKRGVPVCAPLVTRMLLGHCAGKVRRRASATHQLIENGLLLLLISSAYQFVFRPAHFSIRLHQVEYFLIGAIVVVVVTPVPVYQLEIWMRSKISGRCCAVEIQIAVVP